MHWSHLGFLRTATAEGSAMKMGATVLQEWRVTELDDVREELQDFVTKPTKGPVP
jgi:hypothetical protein